MSLETPECEAHGGSSNARGKRPPAVEINSFSSYPKNTDLRTNIYFALERLLGYSTITSQFISTTKIEGNKTYVKSLNFIGKGVILVLGISIYLGSKKVVDQEAYIRQMRESGFRSIFTSLHIPEDDSSNYEEQLKELGKLALKLEMELMADISPTSLKALGFDWSNAEKLVNWGLTGLRIDYGVPETTIIELSHKMKIALNASTLTEEALERMRENGLNTDAVEAWHNFYPRPETGIALDDFIEKNKWLKKAGLTVMAFVPGDGELRGPLYQTLPTLEKHREVSPFVGFMELGKCAHVDKTLIGDVGVKEATLKQFNAYQHDEILLHAIPVEGIDLTMLQRVSGYHKNRPDSARDCFRSVESRQFASLGEEDIKPYNCVERPTGTITIDNKKYLRYQGEIQITKRDLPADEKVNVIGRVIPEDRSLLQWIKGDQKVRIQF